MINYLPGGGAEKVLISILKHIDRKRFEPHLLLIINEGIYKSELPSDIKLLSFFGSKENIKGSIARFIYCAYRRLLLYIASKIPSFLKFLSPVKERFDIGISFNHGYATALLWVQQEHFSKKVAWFHNDVSKYDTGFNETILKKIASLDKLFFVSKDSLDGFYKTYRSFENSPKLEVLYNPLDEEEITACLKKDEPVTFEKFTILSIGRLTAAKRFDKLINAHRKLLDMGIDHEIWILGEGSDKPLLEEQIRSLKVGNSCFLKGFIPNPYTYLKAADIFVMTSDYEGFPVVITESMHIGTAIVATNITGIREALSYGKYGLLVENDETSIIEGISEMITNAEMRNEYERRLETGKENFIFSGAQQVLEDKLYSL